MTQPPAQPQQPWNPGRAAGNTVIVIVTLVFVLCVLPVAVCLGFGLFGNLAAGVTGH
jgi:hypothetical protein